METFFSTAWPGMTPSSFQPVPVFSPPRISSLRVMSMVPVVMTLVARASFVK